MLGLIVWNSWMGHLYPDLETLPTFSLTISREHLIKFDSTIKLQFFYDQETLLSEVDWSTKALNWAKPLHL